MSGKPGPKVSSLIEMYREKVRQAASSKGSPSKSAGTSSQDLPTQPPALVVKETALLAPPPPPQVELSLSALDFPVMEQLEEDELEGTEKIMWSHRTLNLIMVGTAHSYIHGAPLHNVVEEEEEE